MDHKSGWKPFAVLLVALTILGGSSWYVTRQNAGSASHEIPAVVSNGQAPADTGGEKSAMLASPFGLQLSLIHI